MPMQRHLYPPDWPQIVARVRERSGNRCEWCGAVNGLPHPVTGSRVVLTTAHLNHQHGDCRMENLAHLCQSDHLRYDLHHHMQNARRTRAARLAKEQRDLFED